jgi:hypothetical protein
MSLLLFLAGVAIGVVGTVIAGVVIINRPLPERERPIYSAIGSGPARTSGPESTFDFIQRRLR